MNPKAFVARLQAEVDATLSAQGGAYYPVSLRTYSSTPAADPDLGAPTAPTHTDLPINPPPGVESVSAREAESSGGVYLNGDRKFTVSGSALSWAQLNARMADGSLAAQDLVIATPGREEVLRIVERTPQMIKDGQVVSWKLVAGIRRSS